MNIWVVEDEDPAANEALEVISRLGLKDDVHVFRDRAILWSADLETMPPIPDEIPLSKLEHMPDIVILDLLDLNLKFAAGKYYERLRAEETTAELPAAFVIVWSVKTGLEEVYSFLSVKPMLDRRLEFTNSKSEAALEAALVRALRNWREAEFL